MTAEQIRDKHCNDCSLLEAQEYSNVVVAMEEYAQQQAVAFMKWTLQSQCEYSCTDEDQWTNINDATESITTEQLYEKYIAQQSNQ
jgi:hypothetical protein